MCDNLENSIINNNLLTPDDFETQLTSDFDDSEEYVNESESESLFKNECNKAMPCTIYPQCICQTYNYKKVLCRKFPMCVDPGCVFAHEELAHLYRTKMCYYGKSCNSLNWCLFAHNEYELRTNPLDPIKGHTFIPEYNVFERDFPLNPELRLVSRKLDKILDKVQNDDVLKQLLTLNKFDLV